MTAWSVSDDRDALALQVASTVADALCEIVATRGTASLALGVGDVSKRVARCLASHRDVHRVPWTRVEIFPIDEACVPPRDPRSHFGLLSEALVGGEHEPGVDGRLPAPVQPLAFHRPRGDWDDRDEAARRYAEQFPEALDVLLLEVGVDGAIASLAPRARALGEFTRRVAATHVDRPPRARLTITPPVVASARHVFVAAGGLGVASAVSRSLEGPWDPTSTPAQLARHGRWFLDAEAASCLNERRAEAARAWRRV